MSNTLLTSITVISKTSTEWMSQNPVISSKQAAYSTDTKELRIGNGILSWSLLPVDTTHGTVPPHNVIHFTGGRDAITPADIGAAPLDETNKVPITNLPDATTSGKGIVQLNNTVTSTSTVLALTAAQGKILKDLIDSKQSSIGYTPEDSANKNAVNGYAGLDASGKILESLLPSIAIVDVYESSSQITMLALSAAKRGDICIRTDINKTFILAIDGYATLSNWKELRTPTDIVQSVAGKTGTVTLIPSDVGVHKLTSTNTIAAGASASIGFPATFLTAELEFVSVDIKFKDTDGKYYSAIGVAYYAIDKTTRTIQIFNDYTTSLEFVISIRN